MLTSSPDPLLDPIHLGDTVTVTCLLSNPGNPPATMTWFRDNKELTANQRPESRSRDHFRPISFWVEVTISEMTSTEVSCEAVNPVSGERARSSVSITPTATSSTTTTSTTASTIKTTTTAPRPHPRIHFAESQMLLARRKYEPVDDMPMADAPSTSSHNSDYDYSHFEYLNENFDAVYKDTVRYADEYYDSEEYYEDPLFLDKAKYSDIIKKLKEEFEEVSSSSLPSKCSISFMPFIVLNLFKHYYC